MSAKSLYLATEHARKNRVLDHENSTSTSDIDSNTQAGTQVGNIEIRPVTTDDKHKDGL